MKTASDQLASATITTSKEVVVAGSCVDPLLKSEVHFRHA